MSPCPKASDRLGGARASEGLRAGGRGLDRRRGAAALGSRPSARPGEGRSTGCLSPLPSLFHLRPRPQGPGPIALVEPDARDGQRRRTRPPYQTGHEACATGGQRPSGPSRPSGARCPWVSLRPWEAVALTADVTDEREKGPSSLGPRGPRETPGRVPSQCPASSRCRAASEAGPPMGGSRDSSLLRRPVLRGTPHCGIQGASDTRRWETGRPGEEAAGEPRGQPRGPQALPPPSAPEPGVGAASVALPAGCSGDPGARCPTPAVWRRSSRPQALPPLPGAAFRPLRLDFCVPLCSHRFQQEPSPRPRHRTRPLILGHPGDGRWLGPPQRGAWQAGSP